MTKKLANYKRHPNAKRGRLSHTWTGAPEWRGTSGTTSRFSCFNCRICFHNGPNNCPECGGKMLSCGEHFRAPKRADKREWKKLELWVRTGGWFHHDGSGLIPSDPRQLKEVIKLRRIRKVAPWKKRRTDQILVNKYLETQY